jgi:hypothetical protein
MPSRPSISSQQTGTNTPGRELTRKLKQVLWPSDTLRPVNIWEVLDGAQNDRVFDLVSRCYLEKCCLFAGDLSPQLERAAPHLVELSPRDSITDEILESGWGQAWGIFVQSDASLQALRKHLRTFLRVKDETGRYLLFRYYDPRVLSIYLPTCLAGEVKTIFGSLIIRFFVETGDAASITAYEVGQNGQLETRLIRL